jgi:hypothetical protein
VLHAGGGGRPRVQLVVQGPGASDVAAELERRLDLLRDATRVELTHTAATAAERPPPREGAWTDSATDDASSDGSGADWEVAGSSDRVARSAAALPVLAAFRSLPLDVRRLPDQLGGSDDQNRTRVHSAWSQGVADRDLLAYDARAELPAAAHDQNLELVAGLQLKWHVVLRTATPTNQASFITSRARLAHASTHVARRHLAYTLSRRFASLTEATAYCRGAGLDGLPRRV